VPLDGLATTFRYAKGVLTLDPLAFSTYGGREQGSATVDVNGKGSRYAVRTTLTGLDAGAALAGMTQVKDKLTGSANVTANVTGTGSDAAAVERSLAGTVQLDIANGILHGMPILARLNSALGADAGGAAAKSGDTPFQALHGTAHIANGRAQLTNLHVTAGEVSLTGSGTVGFDHTVNLSLVAQLSAAAANTAAAGLGGLASRLGDVVEHLQSSRGTIAVPVTVTGSLAAPKIGVDVGALAKAQVQNQLQQQVERLMGVSREDTVPGVRRDTTNAAPNPVAGIVQGLQQLLQKH
jgi:AsmA protein